MSDNGIQIELNEKDAKAFSKKVSKPFMGRGCWKWKGGCI